MTDFDVIVAGAGYAGATAARELATRGYRVLVLEARDRIGGRTCTSQLSSGELVELGGTYFHWLQPHTWSEITRYGLVDDIIEGGDAPEWELVPHDGGLKWLSAAEQSERARRLLTEFYAESRSVMPRPYQPLFAGQPLADADAMSIQDRLDQLALSEGDRAFLIAFLSSYTLVPPAQGSYVADMRWWAPAGHDYHSMEEAVFGYRLKHGTVSLVSAILADGGAELRLNSPVTAIKTLPDGTVLVTTATGTAATSRAVVVAVPTGVWPHLKVRPMLAPERLAAAREGMQAPEVSKGYLVLRGERRRISVLPRWQHPICMMATSHLLGEDRQIMVFWGSELLGDPTLPAVNDAVRSLLPEAEVVEVVARRYWAGDEHTRGAWGVLKPGQLTRLRPHESFSRAEGRVFFATADIATGWTGYVDGAIESGLVAARQVRALLGEDRT